MRIARYSVKPQFSRVMFILPTVISVIGVPAFPAVVPPGSAMVVLFFSG